MTQHASSSSAPPPGLEPTHAERARTLLLTEKIGTLATQSQRHPGFPFASVMPYAVTADGAPLFLISGMAIHTHNLVAESRCSLLVMQSGADDVLGAARATLMGTATRVPTSDDLRNLYLERHPSARHWIDFSDFSFFRLDVSDIYFVGGFGVMGWVAADDYRTAAPDPLAGTAAFIIEHMNTDHREALREITRHFGGVAAEEATILACDRLGFAVRATTSEGMKGLRIQFPEPVLSADEARKAFVAMTRTARG